MIRGKLAAARRVMCIGAGVIGLEIASSACRRGARVTVLEALPRAMGRSVSPEGAQFVETLHRDAGVALHFGVIVDAIEDARAGGLHVICRGGAGIRGRHSDCWRRHAARSCIGRKCRPGPGRRHCGR